MKAATFLLCLFHFAINTACRSQQVKPFAIIPQPVSVKMAKGTFVLSAKTVLAAPDEAGRQTAAYLNNYLQQHYGFVLPIADKPVKNYVQLLTCKLHEAPKKDGYELTITAQGIQIQGDTYAGTFYGVQTLLQLLPPVANGGATSLSIQCAAIQDYPRFAYRGMHLDVTRHFFSPDFVKKYIDYLALHKLNYFHWHLTDDQGWRIEIKKYPLLQSTAAYRNGTIVGRYPGTGNDNIRYGGFYTQQEVKEIVAYAQQRHITVVPEIEMPGHSSAAIAAYSWLSCFPKEETVIPSYPSQASQKAKGKKVQETWGVFEDIFCAGNDSTFHFLQEVLSEIMPLFPSPYIHIGGDEAPKSNWKICPRCQARIQAQGLKDEHGLQSYFIRRIEKYINAAGKNIIGWDEILEGGLAPNAIVMSWRGEKGGIEAARQNHSVIMTPEKPFYFDHTQSKNEDSLVIGGYNPLGAVYNYEPVSKELDSVASRYVLGAQANLWTEYITTPAKVEYMVFPRMAALSEVLWSPKEKRSWKNFESRLAAQFGRYNLWKASYSRAYYGLTAAIVSGPNGSLAWHVTSKAKDKSILLYNQQDKFAITDTVITITPKPAGSSVNYYAELVSYKQTGTKRTAIRPGEQLLVQPFHFSKATGKKAAIATKPNQKYPGQGGAFSLVNGVYSNKGLSYPDWLGWVGDDIEATIDLGKLTIIDSVRMHTLNQNGSWVYLPQYVEVLTSDDGKNFTPVGRSSTFIKDTLTMGWITVPVQKKSSRYIKLVAKNYGLIPDGQPGGGNKAWLFADEVQVL